MPRGYASEYTKRYHQLSEPVQVEGLKELTQQLTKLTKVLEGILKEEQKQSHSTYLEGDLL